MLTSISPLGERARGNRFWRTAAAYAAGSLLGGAAVGALLGALGSSAGIDGRAPAAFAALALLAMAGVALDGLGKLPTLHRQVDERWLATYRGWVYGAGFGVQLGAGIATIVTASVTYVALAAALLTGSPAGGALVGATFGMARALPLTATARVRSAGELARLHRWLARVARPVDGATRAAQAAVAITALALAGVAA